MSKVLYFLATFAEAGLSMVGIRSAYDQPAYRVVQTLAPDIELRAYAPRHAAETTAEGANDGAAFGRLFRYITGANLAGSAVARAPAVERTQVERSGAKPVLIPMTVPVEMSGGATRMRFFLPASVAAGVIPRPTDPLVRIVELPAASFGVVRFSGTIDPTVRARQTGRLRQALATAGLRTAGDPLVWSYDPPFTVGFLRRNEVALEIVP